MRCQSETMADRIHGLMISYMLQALMCSFPLCHFLGWNTGYWHCPVQKYSPKIHNGFADWGNNQNNTSLYTVRTTSCASKNGFCIGVMPSHQKVTLLPKPLTCKNVVICLRLQRVKTFCYHHVKRERLLLFTELFKIYAARRTLTNMTPRSKVIFIHVLCGS